MSFLRSVQHPGKIADKDDYKCVVCGAVYQGMDAALAVGVGINCLAEPPPHALQHLVDQWKESAINYRKGDIHPYYGDAEFKADCAKADAYEEAARQLSDAISKLDRGRDEYGFEYFKHPGDEDENYY
jgi:hypothetical protein